MSKASREESVARARALNNLLRFFMAVGIKSTHINLPALTKFYFDKVAFKTRAKKKSKR